MTTEVRRAWVMGKLIKGEIGFYVENDENGREVAVDNMIGGRYTMLEGPYVAGQTNDAYEAMRFLLGEE